MPNLSETIRERMASLNDESLVKIVTEDAGQYSTDALKIANEEILARKIDIGEVLEQIKTMKGTRIEKDNGSGLNGASTGIDAVSDEDSEDEEACPDIMPDPQGLSSGNVFLSAKEYYKNHSSAETPQIRPWIRLFARCLDEMLISTLLIAIFRIIHAEVNMKLLNISIVLPVTAFFEGLFLHWWGATPGKWILKIKVTDKAGVRLSYAKSYKRSLMVLLFGEALGIVTTLSYFTWLLAYFRLKYLGKTYWDHKNQTTVVHEKIGVARALLYVFIILALFVFFSVSVLY